MQETTKEKKMAHEIENNNAFFVKTKPWHDVGHVIENAPTIEEGIKLAGLDWNVRLENLYLNDGREVANKATIRESDNSILGVVGNNYSVLQNIEAFSWFNPLLESGLCKLESAGSLFEGKRLWILAKLTTKQISITDNDIIDKYILLSNSHDSTMSVRVGFTPIRVVCNNTLTMAKNSKESSLLRIKHTKNLNINLEMLRSTINLIDADFEATADQYRLLAKTDINKADLEKYIKIVYNIKDLGLKKDGTIKESKLVNNITELFETGRGVDITKPSLWRAYNAITEYNQYSRSDTTEGNINSVWFSTGKEINEKALETALKMAA